MTQIGTQKTKYTCSRCGKNFDSAQELREHEEKCTGQAETDPVQGAVGGKPRKESKGEVKEDMHIEDRFEATDN